MARAPLQQVGRLAVAALQYGSSRASVRAAADQRIAAEQLTAMFEQAQQRRTEQAIQNLRYSRPHIVIPSPVPGLQRFDGNDVMLGMDAGMVRLAAAGFGRDLAGALQKEALSLQPLVAAAKGAFGQMGALKGAIKAPAIAGGAKAVASSATPSLGQAMNQMGGVVGKVKDMAGALPGQAQKLWSQSGVNTVQGAKRTAGALALGAGALYLGGKAMHGATNVMSREGHSGRYGTQNQGGSRIAYGVNEYGNPDLRAPLM
jgi:hypothetical protein